MNGIQATSENLKAAVDGENYESVSMYPEFIKYAEAEQDKKALRIYSWALEVEKIHERLYCNALANLGKEKEEFDCYVCPICDYTHERGAPDLCPVCGAVKEKFEHIS